MERKVLEKAGRKLAIKRKNKLGKMAVNRL